MTNEELALKIQSGEKDLMMVLWEQNQGIVNQKAYTLFSLYRNRCASCGVELDDIIQICFFALRDAVQAYQPERGFKLLSYLKFPLLNHFNSLVGIRKRNLLDQCKSLNESGSGRRSCIMYELIIQNGNQVFQPSVLDGVKWETVRKGQPGKLTFSIVNDGINIQEGNPIRFKVDSNNVFFGFIFKKERNKENIINITAYD